VNEIDRILTVLVLLQPVIVWFWPRLRYACLRLHEYPEVGEQTSPAAMIVFVAQVITSGFFGLGVGIAMIFAILHLPQLDLSITSFLMAELTLGAMFFLYAFARNLWVLDRTYRKFFPRSILARQLAARGYQPARARRSARAGESEH